MEEAAFETYYRRLSLVQDREEKCVVNPQFNHYCSNHRQPTCSNKKPLHCAWKGKLEMVFSDITVSIDGPPKRTYTLHSGKNYCQECVGQSRAAKDAFDEMGHNTIGLMHLSKCTPAEIQAMREKDAARQST